MENPETYRQYAADCRRLAERAAPKDKASLLEISKAWLACAEEAERQEKGHNGVPRLPDKATDKPDDPPLQSR
jgi:hypothetical protein